MVTTFIFASSDKCCSQWQHRCFNDYHYYCLSFRDGQGPSQLHRGRLVWTHASLRGCLHLLRQRHQTCTSLTARLKFHVAFDWGPVSMTVCLQPQDMYYASVKALYTVGYSTSLVSLTTAMVILCRFRYSTMLYIDLPLTAILIFLLIVFNVFFSFLMGWWYFL